MPPPPPPPTAPSFQTCSSGGELASSIAVPPTPSTYGWLAGSSTDTGFWPRIGGGGLLRVAVVRAVVAGGREHGLALRGRLLEQVVLGFLEALLPGLQGLLAEAPAGRDDLVAVGVDDRRVLVERVVDVGVGVRRRAGVDVDLGAGRDRRQILDVEARLAGAGSVRLAAVDRVQVQAPDHLRRPRGAEVAGVERADVRAQERLELVDGDPLAGTGIAGVVETGRAVGVGDLVVGQPAELRGGAGRVSARLRAAGRGRDRGRAGGGVPVAAVVSRAGASDGAGPSRCSRTRSLRPSTAVT